MDRRTLPSVMARYVSRQLTVDLFDETAVEGAFAALAEVRALQHVIGIAGGGDAEELDHPDPPTESLEIFSRVVRNNLHIAFVTVRHTVPLLRHSVGDRSITLIGSINASGGYGAPGYSAAKAGLSGLVAALRRHLAGMEFG